MTSVPDTPHYRLSIRRPVTMAMLFLTLVIFGWKSYMALSINLMPDLAYPTLSVRTLYEGAAPADVEKLVTRPLEERLSTVTGVEEITSVSSAGLSEVVLEFRWGTNMNIAMQDVRDSLDQVLMPEGVTRRPVILRYDPSLDPVLRIALVGRDVSHISDPEERRAQVLQDLTEIRESAKEDIKSDLEAETGIAQVIVKGGREEEIQIMLDSSRLKSLGLTPDMIVSALQQHNVNLSGGRLKEGKAEYLVRTLNEFQNVEEIRSVIISTPGGQQFHLADIAKVDFGIKERETIVRVNGQEAVELECYKEGSANIVEVAKTLKSFFRFEEEGESFVLSMMEYMAKSDETGDMQKGLDEVKKIQEREERLRNRLPDYARAILITDQSRFIEASIREVKQTALLGGLLALCILFMFLRELKSTLIIGLAIPISVVATFVPMMMQSISLNIMSLGGLALGVGMLVDNSIVVLESIFRCREEGDSIKDAAERGTREVASAVTASTLTTIAVFFPIIFIEGIAGQLFKDLALTVTFSLMASLLVALYLIPMIASREGWVVPQDGKSVSWLLRGLRESRKEGVQGIRMFFRLPSQGCRYGVEGARSIFNNTITEALDARRARNGIMRFLYLGVILVATCSWAKCMLTAFLQALFATFLSIASLCMAGMYAVVSLIMRGIFYIPLTVFKHGFLALRSLYSTSLRQVLRLSPLVLLGVFVLAYMATLQARELGRELIPPMKQGEFGIRIEAEPGTQLENTEQKAMTVEAIIQAFDEVESVTVQVGGEASSANRDEDENVAVLTVKLKNPEETAKYQDALIEEMRQEVLARTSEKITFTLPALFSFKTAFEFQLYGEEFKELKRLSEEVYAKIHDVEGFKDPELSLKRGYPEIHVVLDRELLSSKNIEPFQVAQLLRTEVQGDVATKFNRDGEKIDIRVRSDRNRLTSLEDLKSLSILGGNPPIPLSAVAEITVSIGPSEIRRIDQREVVLFTANIEGRDLGSVASEVRGRMKEIQWPEGYTYLLGGQQRELETSYKGLLFAIALAIFLVYVVMACQFESVVHPMFIMLSVPLAFIGVVYGLSFMNLNLSIVVFIGGIVLAGLVVNSAIVLVDYINQLRARGLSKMDAIVEAGTVRFRPIIMTTATTLLGLLPMALSQGEGAEIRGPMAITVMTGLASATLLTLFIIPAIYYLFAARDRT